MKANLEDLKADLYNVFVKGDANNREMARVYLLLTAPILTVILALGII
jgi:hypothetical protein